MQEKVIIQKLEISRKSQLCMFQLKVPSDAKKIIGFESTVTGAVMEDVPVFGGLPLGLFLFQRSAVIGEIRIQSLEKPNLFYTDDVYFNDLNNGFGDFTQRGEWLSSMWTKGLKKEESPIRIDGCSAILQGNYTDIIGRLSGTDLIYTVNLYLWYATELS